MNIFKFWFDFVVSVACVGANETGIEFNRRRAIPHFVMSGNANDGYWFDRPISEFLKSRKNYTKINRNLIITTKSFSLHKNVYMQCHAAASLEVTFIATNQKNQIHPSQDYCNIFTINQTTTAHTLLRSTLFYPKATELWSYYVMFSTSTLSILCFVLSIIKCSFIKTFYYLYILYIPIRNKKHIFTFSMDSR